MGSVNLTSAAHQKGGNFESGFLIEPELERPPEWWLTLERTKPAEFLEASEEDEASGQGPGVALALRFSWETGAAEAFWEGADASPRLELDSLGSLQFALDPLPAGKWVTLGTAESKALAGLLPRTSLVTVKIEGKEPARILVQEVGMAHKPSILLNMSVADILKCWAALTPEQKAILIEERYQEISTAGSALVPAPPVGRLEGGTLFDAFAGIFHAFGSLERSVLTALEGKRWNEAVHLLFGKKYDSLPHLLEKVLAEPADEGEGSGGRVSPQRMEPVNRYVILLCARQLLDLLKDKAPQAFREQHPEDFRRLEEVVAKKSDVEAQLNLGTPEEKTEFLRWFDSWFLRRAEPAEVEKP